MEDEFFSFDVDAAPTEANIVFLEDEQCNDADDGTVTSMIDANTVNTDVEMTDVPVSCQPQIMLSDNDSPDFMIIFM